MIARDCHELMRALEAQSILDCADMAAPPRCTATESRWGLYHHRADYPESDDENWFCHSLLTQGTDGKPQLTKKAVAPYVVPIAEDEHDRLRQAAHPFRRSGRIAAATRSGDDHASRQIPQTTVPVVVDESKCIADKGCTVCVDVCPLDVLRISDLTGKAYMKYDECWYCMPCEADCPTGAVTVNIPYLLK